MKLADPFMCAIAVLLTGCSMGLRQTSTPVADRPPLLLREGPVNIEAKILADPRQQQARFGRVVDHELFKSVLPVEVTVENRGLRSMTVRSSETLLLLYGGHRYTPLDPADAARRLQETYDAMARAQSPVEYPLAGEGMKTARFLCAEPNLLCLVPWGFTFVGGLVDTGRMAVERIEHSVELRRTKATLNALLADVRSPNRLVAATLHTGERATMIVYFGIGADHFRKSETAALIVRLDDTAPTGSPLVFRLWLRGEPSSASY